MREIGRELRVQTRIAKQAADPDERSAAGWRGIELCRERDALQEFLNHGGRDPALLASTSLAPEE